VQLGTLMRFYLLVRESAKASTYCMPTMCWVISTRIAKN